MSDLTEWAQTVSLAQVAAWAGGIGVVVVAVWKGWPAFRKVVRQLSRAVALVDTLATLPDDLAAIRHELEHNDGGSVKDAAVRTEKAVADLTERVETLSGDVAHVRRQAASLKTSVAKTNRRLSAVVDQAQN